MRVLILAVSVLMAGCASTERMRSLDSMAEVTYGNRAMYGHESMDAAKFSYPLAQLNGDALPACIAESVQNGAVALSQDSSYVGAYTGRVYNSTTTRETAGGQVLSYVSDDRRSVSANGAVHYRAGLSFSPSEFAVRYSLAARATPTNLDLTFNRLERAQLSTGYVKNDGFSPIGTWEAASPDKALSALKETADSIRNCVDSR